MKRYTSCLIAVVLLFSLSLVPAIGAAKTPIQMQVYYQNPLAGVDVKVDRVRMSYSSTKMLVAQHMYSVADPSVEVWSFTLGGKEVTPEKFVELWIKAANSPDCDAGCSFSLSGNWNGNTSDGWKAFWAANMPSKTQNNVKYNRITWSSVGNAERYMIQYIDSKGQMCYLLMYLGKGITSLSFDQIIEELGKRAIELPADGKIQLQIIAYNKAGVSINSSAIFTVDLSSKMVAQDSKGLVQNRATTLEETKSFTASSNKADSIPYDLWRQNDSGWANEVYHEIDWDVATIGEFGCNFISLGILAGMAGLLPEQAINPYEWAMLLREKGQFDDTLPPGRAGNTKSYSEIFSAVGIPLQYDDTKKDTSMSAISKYLNDGYYIMIAVKNKGHYVAVKGIDGNGNLLIIDPTYHSGETSSTQILTDRYTYADIVDVMAYKVK